MSAASEDSSVFNEAQPSPVSEGEGAVCAPDPEDARPQLESEPDDSSIEAGAKLTELYGRLFDKVYELSGRYVGFTDPFRVAHTAWCLGTWSFGTVNKQAYQRFGHYPRLQVTGMKGTGKSTAAKVTAGFCYMPERLGLETPATIFRLADDGCTLLLDEMDTQPHPDVRKVLRLGFERGQQIPRCETVKGQIYVEKYNVYAPVFISGQGAFDDDALQSRTITENMSRVPERENGNWPPELPASFTVATNWLAPRIGKVAPRYIATIDTGKVWKEMEADNGLPRMDSRDMQVFMPIWAMTPEKHRENLRLMIRRHTGYVTRMSAESPSVTVFLALLDMGKPKVVLPGELAKYINTALGIDHRHPDAFSGRGVSVHLRRMGLEPSPDLKHTRLGNPFSISVDEYTQLAVSLDVKVTEAKRPA